MGVMDKTTVTVFKEVICSKCQERYEVRLEPVYDGQGFLKYARDDHAVNICPSCGNADRGERLTKEGKVFIGE